MTAKEGIYVEHASCQHLLLILDCLGGVGVLLGPFKNCVSLSTTRGDWSSFQLAISKHRLDLICIGIAPSAKMLVDCFHLVEDALNFLILNFLN